MAKILIVEDDADLVETYVDLLEAKGYATISAVSVADAIQLAVSEEPSIVILDLALPGGSGVSVLDFIRSHERLRNTRILVISGRTEMANLGLADKADIILTKPVSNEQLVSMIDRLLRQSGDKNLSG